VFARVVRKDIQVFMANLNVMNVYKESMQMITIRLQRQMPRAVHFVLVENMQKMWYHQSDCQKLLHVKIVKLPSTHPRLVLTLTLGVTSVHQAGIPTTQEMMLLVIAKHVLQTHILNCQRQLHVKIVATPKNQMQVQHFVPNVQQENTCRQIVFALIAILVKSAQRQEP